MVLVGSQRIACARGAERAQGLRRYPSTSSGQARSPVAPRSGVPRSIRPAAQLGLVRRLLCPPRLMGPHTDPQLTRQKTSGMIPETVLLVCHLKVLPTSSGTIPELLRKLRYGRRIISWAREPLANLPLYRTLPTTWPIPREPLASSSRIPQHPQGHLMSWSCERSRQKNTFHESFLKNGVSLVKTGACAASFGIFRKVS